MAGMTAADSLTAVLRTQAFSDLQEGVYYNNELFPLLQRIPFTGGSTVNVKHHTAGNTSVATYSEGDAVGTPGTESYTTSSWTPTYFKASTQITGHARDQLRNGSPEAGFFDQISMELTNAMKAIVDKATTDILGATGSITDILDVIDDDTTCGGITRSSNSWFQSVENAIAAGSFALSDIDILWRDARDAENAANCDTYLTSWTQINKIKQLSALYGSSNPFAFASASGPVEVGPGWSGMTFAGVPITAVRNLTSSVHLMFERSAIGLGVQRDWQVDQLAKTDDSDKFMITGALCIVGVNPRKAAKLTGA